MDSLYENRFKKIFWKYLTRSMIFDIAFCFPQCIYYLRYVNLDDAEFGQALGDYRESNAYIVLMALKLFKLTNLVRVFSILESMRDALKRRFFHRRNMIQNIFMWIISLIKLFFLIHLFSAISTFEKKYQ